MITRQPVTKAEARRLVAGCFLDLRKDAELGFLPITERPDLERDEQRDLSRQRINALQQQVNLKTFDAEIRTRAILLTGRSGIAFLDQPEGVQADIMEGVARACIEQTRLQMFRLDDRLAPYDAVDPLFKLMPTNDEVPCCAAASGKTLGELRSLYLKYGELHWVPKTLASRQRQLALIVEFFGQDMRVDDISSARMREYRDALMLLRARKGNVPTMPFAKRQTADPTKRIAPKTALLIFETAKCFFRWAKQEAYIANDPSVDLQVKLPPVKAKGKRSRKPFTSEQLTQIFTSPVFQGSLSIAHRTQQGTKRIYDAKFWVPLIGFYSGLRLSEIIQLQLSDITVIEGIDCINVSEEGGGERGSGDHKHVKSAAGIRLMPIHADLIQLGFLKFVERRRKAAKGKGRLFHEVKYGADGMPSSAFSKWFGRFLHSVGIVEPEFVFHSFRHNAQDALRDGMAPQYVIDQVFGHADRSASSCGEGNSLKVCQEAVANMRFKVDVLSLVSPMC